MAASQQHGFDFESAARRIFFPLTPENGKKNGDLWDVPPGAFASEAVPRRWRGLPVSIKTAKAGGTVHFGDALRQIQVDEDFLMLLGRWSYRAGKKKIVSLWCTKVEAVFWRALFYPLREGDLLELNAQIKNPGVSYQQLRSTAKKLVGQDRFRRSLFGIHPKIGSHGQRRVQCSLSCRMMSILFHEPGSEQPQPSLWGVSGARLL